MLIDIKSRAGEIMDAVPRILCALKHRNMTNGFAMYHNEQVIHEHQYLKGKYNEL